MGEIADMMLDGTLCEACCTPIGDGQSPGFPRYHKRCIPSAHQATSSKVKCPDCGKKVKPVGLADHQRDAHKGRMHGQG